MDLDMIPMTIESLALGLIPQPSVLSLRPSKALALPGEEGEALLEQLLRLERRRGLLLELAIGALLIALCVQVFLMLI